MIDRRYYYCLETLVNPLKSNPIQINSNPIQIHFNKKTIPKTIPMKNIELRSFNMANTSIETLMREKEGISKLLKRSLIIAKTFSRIGDENFACDYLATAETFARRLCSIDSQIKQRESI